MTNQRPFGVTIIAAFMLIVGLVRTVWGIFVLARNPYAEAGLQNAVPEGTSLPASTIPWIGVGFLVIGLLALLVSYGMFTLKGWAWLWTVVVASLNLVGVFISYISNQRGEIDALLSIIIFAVVIYYLSTTPVKRAFGFGRQG